MPNHLASKTVMGLLTILAFATVLVFLNKLTPEMVDVIKWVGTGFMAVRASANYAENMGPK